MSKISHSSLIKPNHQSLSNNIRSKPIHHKRKNTKITKSSNEYLQNTINEPNLSNKQYSIKQSNQIPSNFDLNSHNQSFTLSYDGKLTDYYRNHKRTKSNRSHKTSTFIDTDILNFCSNFENKTNKKPSNRSNFDDQHYEKRKKQRQKRLCAAYGCCPCSPLCLFLSLLTLAILLVALASILLGFLFPKKTIINTTVTTSTTTTTTARPLVAITRAGDFIVGIYNTTAGLSTGGYGNSLSSEDASKAIDNSTSTKYLNFGYRGTSTPPNSTYDQPGVSTGFYITPSINSSSVATTILFATANDYPIRDPISITLEGTNATGSALSNGSSWTLIYNGPTGISSTIDPGRQVFCSPQTFPNTIAYTSYRLLITAQRGNGSGVQYSEAQIFGYF